MPKANDSSTNGNQIQALIDSLDFYALLVDEEHRIAYANKVTEAILGLPGGQIIGQYCPRLVHGVDGAFHGCPLEISIKSGKAEVVEVFDPKHHRWMDSRIYPTPFRSPSGLALYLHFVFDITEKRKTREQLDHTLGKLRAALGGIIQIIQEIVEKRDPYTAGHQRRVADLARAIAKEMGLSDDQVDAIRMSGIIHDIGKVVVPAEILAKPGRLSDSEFSLIKQHSRSGYDIVKAVDLPWPLSDIILQHHERLDGSGYPQGLRGDGIMIEAKVIAVSDVVEAMSSHRPYRAALGTDEALEEINQKKGSLYDPDVVEACLRLFREKGYRLKD
jgi:putative nucleotidyltransferase with HDIG domain/PAS domain S-box-containing protein